MTKKKHQGHYCKVCGEYKSNESFSGKGHKNHICKKCTQQPKDVREKMMVSTNRPMVRTNRPMMITKRPMRDDLEDISEFFGDIELPFEVNDSEEQSSDAIYYDGYLEEFVGLDSLRLPVYEAKRYVKLKDSEKSLFRGIVQKLVIEFWKENRQIPDGGEVNRIMNMAVKHSEEELSFSVKNDKDLRRMVQSMVVPTINRQLKREAK